MLGSVGFKFRTHGSWHSMNTQEQPQLSSRYAIIKTLYDLIEKFPIIFLCSFSWAEVLYKDDVSGQKNVYMRSSKDRMNILCHTCDITLSCSRPSDSVQQSPVIYRRSGICYPVWCWNMSFTSRNYKQSVCTSSLCGGAPIVRPLFQKVWKGPISLNRPDQKIRSDHASWPPTVGFPPHWSLISSGSAVCLMNSQNHGQIFWHPFPLQAQELPPFRTGNLREREKKQLCASWRVIFSVKYPFFCQWYQWIP